MIGKFMKGDEVIILPEGVRGIISSQADYSPLYSDSPLWNVRLVGSLNKNKGSFRLVHTNNLKPLTGKKGIIMKPQIAECTHPPVIDTLLGLCGDGKAHFEELHGHIYVYGTPDKLHRIKGLLFRRYGIECDKYPKHLPIRLIFNL